MSIIDSITKKARKIPAPPPSEAPEGPGFGWSEPTEPASEAEARREGLKVLTQLHALRNPKGSS